MTIDDLLKPVKWVDEQILTQYTKLAKKIPEKNLYKVTTALNLGAIPGTAMLGFYFNIFPGIFGFIDGIVLHSLDFSYNIHGLEGKIPDKSESSSKSLNPVLEFCRDYNRKIRLPLFSAGIGFSGMAAYDLITNINSEQSFNPYDLLGVSIGIGYLFLASSMYLKDHDTKLLQKDSILKKMRDSLMSKISGLLPGQSPIPDSVQVYSAVSNG